MALIAAYNKKVPRLSTSPDHFQLWFPNENRVQEPLQDVYTLFIDSHLFIISFLRKKGSSKSILQFSRSEMISQTNPTTAPDLDPNKEKELETNIGEIARKLEEARGRYDVMVNQAAEDEERKKADLEQPSLDAKRILPDYLHKNSTSNREIQARFVSHRFLGDGSYGEVDEVRELSTGASYARKHIHLDHNKPSETIANEVRNEVAIMQKLRHQHIVMVLFYLKEKGAYSIFMLPVAQYNLREYLDLCTANNYPPGETTKIYPWFGCLLDALAYAHKMKIKHQDIKPSNIVIKNYQPYLCDFGLAKDFTELDASTSSGQKVHGTLVYRAPENEPNRPRGRPADVFSLGCVYSEMFTVIQGKSLEEYRDVRYKAGSIAFRGCLVKVVEWLKSFESNNNKMDGLLMEQILGMINVSVAERHTAEQAVNFLKRERAFFCVE